MRVLRCRGHVLSNSNERGDRPDFQMYYYAVTEWLFIETKLALKFIL